MLSSKQGQINIKKLLPEETIDIVTTDIFEIEKVEDLEKYFD